MPLYPSTGATIRADINAKVEEALGLSRKFVGARVMPPLMVDAKSGSYPKIDIAGGELASPLATERTPGGTYGEVVRNWTPDTYDCVDRGLVEAVDDSQARDLARFFNAETAAAKLCLQNMQMAHELRVAAATFNTTNYGSATNSVVAYTAANIATIDFVQDVLNAIERVSANGGMANTIVMGSLTYARLAASTKLQSWVKGSLKSSGEVPMSAQNIALSFADAGIEQCLVGGAYYNAAKKGQTKSQTSVWGSTYVWVGHSNPNARLVQDGGSGFTFVWNAEGGLFVTETYRDENRRSNMVRVRQNTVEKVVDGTAGTLIATQYS